MAELSFRVGQRVLAKESAGVVAYVGSTQFAAGKWYGVILDEPNGKNNGTVQGKFYFQCEDNHGVFVRQSQLAPAPSCDSPSGSTPQQQQQQRSGDSQVTPKSSKLITPTARNKSRLPGVGGRLSVTPATPPSSTSASAAAAASSGGGGAPASSTSSSSTTPTSSISSSTRDLTRSSQRAPHSMPAKKSASSQEISRRKTFSPSVPPLSRGGQRPTSATKQSSFVETPAPATAAPPVAAVASEPATVPPPPHSAPQAPLTDTDQLTELNNLRSEVNDLNEKLETLKAKRLQDRERLKEGEKMKIQLTQLQEFKSQMLEQQGQLQKELMMARQERQEAIEARERLVEDTSDVHETLEMAALDKEMAEEKSEVLQAELDQANERLEELRVDLQLLQEELQQKCDSGQLQDTSFQCRQLQQQNERLREALIKLRDSGAQDKHELQRLQKEAETSRATIADLQRDKDKYGAMVKQLEEGMVDLQEHVDAALGSEKMVEHLTERNLAQEERLEEMEEHIKTLESLVDAGEEIAENSRELELELRQELDAAACRVLQMQRQRDAANEMVADHVQTIGKFRELVQRLQQQNEQLSCRLQQQNEQLSCQLQPGDQPLSAVSAEKIDFQKMFAETKAHAKAVEMDLRKIEVLQANKHVKLLCDFLPDCFMARGGDHDAILTQLLVSRVSMKVETLLVPVRDKFPLPPPPPPASATHSNNSTLNNTSLSSTVSGQVEDAAAAGGGDSVEASQQQQQQQQPPLSSSSSSDLTVEQSCFASRLMFLLLSLQSTVDQFSVALETVDVDTMMAVSQHYAEMAAHEKCLDHYIQLLRDDQLGENISLDKLEKIVGYFTSLYSSTLSAAPIHHFSYLLSLAKSVGAACTSILADTRKIRSVCAREGEAAVLFSWLSAAVESCGQLVKRLRRQLPQDRSTDRISFSDKVYASLSDCMKQCYRVSAVVNYTAANCGKLSTDGQSSGDAAAATGAGGEVIELVTRAVDLYYGASDDHGAQSVRTSISGVCESLEQFVTALENGEFDFDGSASEQKRAGPLQERMAAVRSQLQESACLKQRLLGRDEELQQLRLALRLKQQELSEAGVRREMAEKKLTGATRDADLTIEKLQRKLDDATALLKRKQHEFDETMNHLQTDLESLELERGQLKDKLKQINKKALIDGLSKSAAAAAASAAAAAAAGPTPGDAGWAAGEEGAGGLTVTDSPGLLREVSDLRHVVRRQRQQLAQQQLQRHRASCLSTLSMPDSSLKTDSQLTALETQCSQLQAELSALDMPLAMPDWSSASSRRHYLAARASRQLQRHQLLARYQQLQLQVLEHLGRQTDGGTAVTSFGTFPSVPLTQSLVSLEPLIQATLVTGDNVSPLPQPVSHVTCQVSVGQLCQLHQRVLARVAPVV